jgi:hypothetical protein
MNNISTETATAMIKYEYPTHWHGSSDDGTFAVVVGQSKSMTIFAM